MMIDYHLLWVFLGAFGVTFALLMGYIWLEEGKIVDYNTLQGFCEERGGIYEEGTNPTCLFQEGARPNRYVRYEFVNSINGYCDKNCKLVKTI